MNYYCTLFDSFYLSKGLVMYESLKNCSGEFHLFIFAFDDLSATVLQQMNPGSVTVIPLKDFESSELLAIKDKRTKAEYCWTCTPSVISYSIEKYNLPECTYIDADLFFYSDPAVLVNEMKENNKSILITEHRFSLLPRWHGLKRAGRFCVQFLTVRNVPEGKDVLETWKNQCIDWCYARYEDGRFGDQKYLEDWPEKYSAVHILYNPGGGLAPWNIQQYRFKSEGNRFNGEQIRNGKRFDVIFYHFQYVKMISEKVFDIGWYQITGKIKKLFYIPYLEKLILMEQYLRKYNTAYNSNFAVSRSGNLKEKLKSAFKRWSGYNILKIS